MDDVILEKNKESIFIHSLFRSGSTYIFKKFRENSGLYTCYQEPVHEIGIMASQDHEILNQDTGSKKNDQLRHPVLSKSYFYELYNIADKALPYLKKDDIYNNYFDSNVSSLCEYLNSLVINSTQRCVIQECRLTSRMSAIKQSMAGTHLYLWRNPWDQWWSYKVTDYFDTANLLLLSGHKLPEILQRIASQLNLSSYYNDDILQEFSYQRNIKLNAENSYLLFYSIWVLSLIEAFKSANCVFNIDKLSTSDEYKKVVSNELSELGILDIDFSDCDVPQCTFLNKDIEFFTRIESEVHGLFLDTGYDKQLLDKVLSLRNDFSPKKLLINDELSITEILKDSERARVLTRSYMNEVAFISNAASSERESNEIEIAQLRTQLSEIETRFNQAEARAVESETKANKAVAKASKAVAKANDAEMKTNQLLNSHSWKITKPIRFVSHVIKKILMVFK